MSRILESKLTLRHVLVLGILVATLAISAGALAGSRSSNGAFSSGSIRMSSAKSNTYVSAGTDAVVKVLSTSFNVPSGKSAEVQATFSATLSHNVGQYAYCFGKFVLDGATNDAAFKPGQVQLIGGATSTEPDQISTAMTGYRKSIGAGSHVVNVYIIGSFSGCTLQDRALNVLVNVH